MVFPTILSVAHAPLHLVVDECPPLFHSTLIRLAACIPRTNLPPIFPVAPGRAFWADFPVPAGDPGASRTPIRKTAEPCILSSSTSEIAGKSREDSAISGVENRESRCLGPLTGRDPKMTGSRKVIVAVDAPSSPRHPPHKKDEGGQPPSTVPEQLLNYLSLSVDLVRPQPVSHPSDEERSAPEGAVCPPRVAFNPDPRLELIVEV